MRWFEGTRMRRSVGRGAIGSEVTGSAAGRHPPLYRRGATIPGGHAQLLSMKVGPPGASGGSTTAVGERGEDPQIGSTNISASRGSAEKSG